MESFTDSGRLQRGRSYSGDSRILKFVIKKGRVTATVRGNKNPYFGVYTEPQYSTKIQMSPIPDKDWKKAIQYMGNRAGLVSRLLMNEMPDNIDEAFGHVKLHLLPRSHRDFTLTDCSCPDYANPCKHIAGVYYRLASQLDQDPFLLFELRGLSRDKLHQVLSKSPLGEVLASMMDDHKPSPVVAESYYTQPLAASKTPDYHAFWHGQKRLPGNIEPAAPATVPAVMIKKAGDFPPFWNKDSSFVEIMEELYQRVRTNNKDVF